MADFEEKIKDKFAGVKAWAVVSQYHSVGIGCWDGKKLVFHPDVEYDAACVTELRIFNESAELRFANGKERYADDKGKKLHDTSYLLYGTDVTKRDSDWICLSEQRGGILWFPKNILFDKTPDGKDQVAMWLKIRHYLQYNHVSVSGSVATGRPVLEVLDYRYVGFAQGICTDKQSDNYGKSTREVLL